MSAANTEFNRAAYDDAVIKHENIVARMEKGVSSSSAILQPLPFL